MRIEERRLKRLRMQNAIKDKMDLTGNAAADTGSAAGIAMSKSPTSVVGKKRTPVNDEGEKDGRKRSKMEKIRDNIDLTAD